MLTALSDPKTLAEIAVIVALVAMNGGPLLSWAASKAAGIKLPSLTAGGASASTVARTPGEVLDCLNADMAYFRDHTDAPADKLKAVEDLTPYLTHVKAAAASPTAPPAPGVAA